MKKHIDEVTRLLRYSEPKLRGVWGIELDEDGFEIAVKRSEDGRSLAFMNVDDAKKAGFLA